MASKRAVVVDTNVPVTANGRDTHGSAECQEACRRGLLEITRGSARLILDCGFEIVNEYCAYLSFRGQPGLGDAFLRWIHDNQFNSSRCERVTLTPHPARGYVEFPEDEALSGFDRDDRKFVAAARASQSRAARVLNAVDSDWWDYELVLQEHGVRLEFVCRDQVERWREERPRTRRGD
jgi:hypothetical protein